MVFGFVASPFLYFVGYFDEFLCIILLSYADYIIFIKEINWIQNL